MEMEFTASERIHLGSVLPGEGDFTALKTIRKLQEDLSLSDKDREEIGFHTVMVRDAESGEMVPSGRVEWDDNATLVKKVKIGDYANAVIVEALKKLSREGHLRLEHFDLYVRFVENKEGEE